MKRQLQFDKVRLLSNVHCTIKFWLLFKDLSEWKNEVYHAGTFIWKLDATLQNNGDDEIVRHCNHFVFFAISSIMFSIRRYIHVC